MRFEPYEELITSEETSDSSLAADFTEPASNKEKIEAEKAFVLKVQDAMKKGDMEPLDTLIQTYQDKLKAFIKRKFNFTDELAEDIIQDAFIKLIPRQSLVNKDKHLSDIHSYNPKKGAFSTWLFNIAKNCARDYITKPLPTGGR